MTTLEEVFRVSDEGWVPNLAKKMGLPELLKRTKTDASADAAGSA